MIIVSNRLPVNPDYAEQFEARFKEREGLVDQMAGFIRFHILRPTQDDQPYIVQTYWESQAAFDAWTESEAFKAQHSQQRRLPAEALLGRPQIEIHEIIQTNDTESDTQEA